MIKKLSPFIFRTYPVLFFFDAVLSLVDDVTLFATAQNYIHSYRSFLASFVVFTGVAYFLNLFFIETKKKTLYHMLPVFNVVGSIFSISLMLNLISKTSLFSAFAIEVSPETVYAKHTDYFVSMLIMSLVQLGLAVYTLKVLKTDSWKFKDERVRYFLAPTLSMTMLAALLLIPLFAVPLILIAGTGGFLGLNGPNITSIERIYQKNGKTLHLVPMVHIGDEAFYKEISKVDGKVKTLYLLEGVSDKDKLLANLDYDKFAEKAGLDLQKKHFNPEAPKELQKNISYKVADIDVSEFKPETREFLKKVFDSMNKKSIFEVMYMGGDKFSAKESASMVVDLVERRNKKVLEVLRENEKDFQEIFIPWGAAHMPEIEREILKSGYKPVASKERVVISLQNVVNKIKTKTPSASNSDQSSTEP